MSIVELSFAAFAIVGFLGIVGIVVIVTGRAPKSFNWKKNLEKKALKEDKSQTNFLEPELPKGETETTIDEIDEPVIDSDGAVQLEEKEIYEKGLTYICHRLSSIRYVVLHVEYERLKKIQEHQQ